ncbi:unnamed protein product [Dicrocoelium dendriticum]|nr:unnamed protein product [Dicrocoelium dendriticum]
MRVCPFDLRFRFVLEDDVEELRALYKECFPVTYPNSWFNDLITNPALISFVALANHRIVAILVAKIITLDECSGEDRNILDRSFPNNSFVAYILSLGVSVAYRSHGIASYLLDSFVSYASGSHYLRMCPHAKTKLQSDDVANGRAIIQHHESLQSVPLRPPVMFSPRDRPYHYNKSYRSLVDVLNMLPPFPPSCCAIYLHVLRTNYAARHFYENRGFRSSHVQLGCYTIAGKPADGCTYVFYMNGGFASEDVVSCPTTDSPTPKLLRFSPSDWIPNPLAWVLQALFRLSQVLVCKISPLLNGIRSPPSLS